MLFGMAAISYYSTVREKTFCKKEVDTLRIFIDNVHKKRGPIIRTVVLNKEECGVAAVGLTLFGELCFRYKWHGFASTAVDRVVFYQSSVDRSMEDRFQVSADFDIFTLDGEVIEVRTCDRKIIEAAIRYAPVVDIRAKARALRGL